MCSVFATLAIHSLDNKRDNHAANHDECIRSTKQVLIISWRVNVDHDFTTLQRRKIMRTELPKIPGYHHGRQLGQQVLLYGNVRCVPKTESHPVLPFVLISPHCKVTNSA